MSEAKGIVKNAGLLLLSEMIGKGLSFFLVIAITSYLGAEGLGKYSFAFAFVGLFSVFSDFGLSTYIVREVARNKEEARKYASSMLALKLVLAVITTVLPIIIVHFIEDSPEVRMSVYIAAIATGFLYMTSVFGTLFAAYERLQHQAMINVVERILTVGLGLLLLWQGAGLLGLMSAYLASYLAVMVIAWVIAFRKTTAFGLSFDTAFWKELLKSSMPFWFTTIFITIYFRIDTVLLQMMTNYEQVGWYNAAYKALDALYFIPGAIITSVFPVMSRFHIDNRKMLQTLYEKAFYYLLLLAIPIAAGITLLSDRIINLIYIGKVPEAGIALQILIWAEAIIFVSSLVGYLLNAINKQLIFTYVTAVAAIINITINLFLIPKYGYVGASIATVATELFVLLLLYHQATKNGYTISLVKVFLKPSMAALAMSAAILMLDFLHIIILIPVAAAVYFGVLFLIKGIGKEEIEIAKEMAKSIK